MGLTVFLKKRPTDTALGFRKRGGFYFVFDV